MATGISSCVASIHFGAESNERKMKLKTYHGLGAAAVQGDARRHVRAVVVDEAGRAVELQLGKVDVGEGGDGKHQNHLRLLTCQHCRQRRQGYAVERMLMRT